MATMNPDWNTINHLQQKATEGELHLLRFLDENLDNSYEVYFQPYLNGDRPDIVIMRKGSGVLIIEVKDWNLKHYSNEGGKWFVSNDGKKHHILSPYQQVKKYKENLYNLHIPPLLEKKIKNQKMFSIVQCALYFHNSNKREFNKFISEESSENKEHISFLTPDQLSVEGDFEEFLKQTYMNKESNLFTEDLYNSFKRIFQPSYNTIEEGLEIIYSEEQKLLIESKPGYKKIKGVAGSGKTMVLAKRAVNSHKRTDKKVLILCYNITLKNYIHDLVSKVRENFNWGYFHIINYHNFISHFLNNMGISPQNLFIKTLKKDAKLSKYANSMMDFEKLLEEIIKDLGSDIISNIWERAIFSNVNFFSKLNISTSDKYDSIFIDEVQDYQYEWLEIIKDNFLQEGGEYILFADEKQNIYGRKLDKDKKVRTNILGRWDESLKKSFRLHRNIATIASEFQREFLHSYEFEQIQFVEQESLFEQNNLKVDYFEMCNEPKTIAKCINDYIKTNRISPNDVAVLGSTVSILQDIDFEFRQISKEKTTTTFETLEIIRLLIYQKYESKSKKGGNNLPHKKYLDDNLQIALRRILNKIDHVDNFISNTEISTSPTTDEEKKFDKFLNDITPRIKMEIENIRKNKKFNFWMNSGFVKLSTIHSFKGWEIPTTFIIIDSSFDNEFNNELLYTAITRTRFNLIVINIGSVKYHNFFKSRLMKK